MRHVVGILAVAGLAVSVGCGSSSSTSPTTTASSAVTTTGSSTMQTTRSSTSSTTGTSSTSTAPIAQNLHVTSALRAELLQAGAATHNLPASAYTGLAAGRTYYAYDPATSTYWAGAALVPSSSSVPAQVSVQDDGSYLLFTRTSAGSWKVESVGMTGIQGAKCPVTVPASVLAVWGWAARTCRPSS
jgi:hypothetical protein